MYLFQSDTAIFYYLTNWRQVWSLYHHQAILT